MDPDLNIPMVSEADSILGRSTLADLLLDSMASCGIDYIFANFGTDHTAIIEAIAKRNQRKLTDKPKIVLAPHEMVAICAATGYYQATGIPQAVMVHVDVGTLNLGAGIHNAARNRTPVLIFAGLTPITSFGELPGSRDNAIHFVQDVYDQPGIIREYIKWKYELRSPYEVGDIVARALQVALSPPQGPVYLLAAREILELEVNIPSTTPKLILPDPIQPTPESLMWLKQVLRESNRPLLITSYIGRDPSGMHALVRFTERFGVGVVETRIRSANFPNNHPLHVGYDAGSLLSEVDLVLVVDCDVPWVPSQVKVRPDVRVILIDEDPLQHKIPYYPFQAERVLCATARLVLDQLADEPMEPGEPEQVDRRWRYWSELHQKQQNSWRIKVNTGERLTGASLSYIISDTIGKDAIYVGELVTNEPFALRYIPRKNPGCWIGNSGSGLGWGLGAAFGTKLARPHDTVVLLVGDGSYLFGHPSVTHWMQRAYKAPFLTIIYNNGGWKAVERALLRAHPQGVAARTGLTYSRFPEPAELSRVVTIVDGYGRKVTTVTEAQEALKEGLAAVQRGLPAVIDARIEWE